MSHKVRAILSGDQPVEEDIDRDITIGKRLDMEEAEATDVKTKWKPTEREYSTKEKRKIVAKVLETAIRTTFKNHIYAFKNKTYQQVSGGAIGLRLTGVVARILMDEWAD